MEEFVSKIQTYQMERGWSDYQFSEISDIPQTTISSWYCKGAIPTIPTLKRVCKAFGITLSQLFAEEGEPVILTPAQEKLLECWGRLNQDQQEAVFQIIDKM